MKLKRTAQKFLGLALGMVWAASSHGAGPSLINWMTDERAAFDRAEQLDRPVLLYLEAVWCHWCHVIDRETYGNAAVAKLVEEHFVPLRIDQDSRPDLANRYRNYGWPATIFLTSSGQDMVKRRGYIAPKAMVSLLQAIVDDPSPEAAAALRVPASYAPTSSLSDALRNTLRQRHLRTHDGQKGGLTIKLKFIERDSTELDLVWAGDGDAAAALRATTTLDAALGLIDPQWGGVYQYSTHGDWNHPHFEKLGALQGEYLRLYALAWAQFREPRYMSAATAIVDYLEHFLRSEEGGFYTSQDADLVQGEKGTAYFALTDSQRRQQGMPKIDTHRYARENGAIIEGLATLYEFKRDARYLDLAVAAADWTVRHRARGDGGFSHDEVDVAGPYLGDSLAMGRGFLALYKATAQRHWLSQAQAAADFIEQHFQAPEAGYVSGVNSTAVIAPVAQIDENISLARFANLLFQIAGTSRHRAIAERAMRFLATDAIATRRITEAGVLLADRELNRAPLHLTVLGAKLDRQALQLFRAMQDQPGWYKRAEWWDAAEGPLPNPDVSYPQLDRAAAFVCTDNRCSLPLFSKQDLVGFLADFGESQ